MTGILFLQLLTALSVFVCRPKGHAQEPGGLPTQNGAETALLAPKVPDSNGGPETSLLALIRKAGGEEKEAEELVGRFLGAGPVGWDPSFDEKVRNSSPEECSRMLGVILIQRGDSVLAEEGLKYLEMAAKEDSVTAMEDLATIYLEGAKGIEPDPGRAVEWLREARQLPGAKRAYEMLGDLAMEGRGMPRDEVLAVEYYRRGVEAGSTGSGLALHRLLREGDRLPRDLMEAERLARAAADAGSPEAAYELGVFYERYVEGAPNWGRASEWLSKAMEGGNTAAVRRLADYWFEGRRGPVDANKGLELLRKAAAMNDGEACLRLAALYETGQFLPQDPVASTAWVRIAAGFGHASAENLYGLRLISGYGVASDPVEAARWFERAAFRGWGDAQVNLATLKQNGLGMETDLVGALDWYAKAAKNGNVDAQERLARLLAESTDSSLRDPLQAAFWAASAAGAGGEAVSGLAAELRDRLSPAQVEELDRLLADSENEVTPFSE
ncbi:MAG: sel1 repeat family protein [Verrucomicrobiae bacterium]|nr:sel1 repeat family protein [Verrucomicrobiae bacterium]